MRLRVRIIGRVLPCHLRVSRCPHHASSEAVLNLSVRRIIGGGMSKLG